MSKLGYISISPLTTFEEDFFYWSFFVNISSSTYSLQMSNSAKSNYIDDELPLDHRWLNRRGGASPVYRQFLNIVRISEYENAYLIQRHNRCNQDTLILLQATYSDNNNFRLHKIIIQK